MFQTANRPVGCLWLTLVSIALTGCGADGTDPAAATVQSTGTTSISDGSVAPPVPPPPLRPGITKLVSPSGPVIKLTPACLAKLKQVKAENPAVTGIRIGAEIGKGCSGFSYQLGVESEQPDPKRDLIETAQGIPVVVERGQVEFFRGTTLDFLPDQAGFVFNQPNPKIELHAGYQKLKQEEARRIAAEMERAKQVRPEQCVAALLTPQRDQAFEDLRIWWNANQSEVASDFPQTVGRVDRYQMRDGEWITVVFTGEPEQQLGGVYLIRASGRQIRMYRGWNYLSDDSQVTDINRDGVPELVIVSHQGGGKGSTPGSVKGQMTHIYVMPITPDQVPLLRLAFDVRRLSAEPTWRWTLTEEADQPRSIILEKPIKGQLSECARFTWSVEKSRFIGPAGASSEGFIAETADFAKDGLDVKDATEALWADFDANKPTDMSQ